MIRRLHKKYALFFEIAQAPGASDWDFGRYLRIRNRTSIDVEGKRKLGFEETLKRNNLDYSDHVRTTIPFAYLNDCPCALCFFCEPQELVFEVISELIIVLEEFTWIGCLGDHLRMS